MKPHTNELAQTMMAYCELMQEIKIRTHGIEEITKAAVPAQIKYESCYLQLRMVCELIALSCLIVHGDIPATMGKMKRTWEADKILTRLSEIHGDFYPHPVNAKEGDKFDLERVSSGFLTKEDLIVLYRKCGDRLHRGTARNVQHKIAPQNVNFVQIQRWGDMIIHLLQHHWIKLHDSGDQIGVQMNALRDKPSWNYWALIGPAPKP